MLWYRFGAGDSDEKEVPKMEAKKVTFKVNFRNAFPHSDSLIPGHFFLSHSVNPLMKGFLNSHAVYVFGYALCLCLLLYVYDVDKFIALISLLR